MERVRRRIKGWGEVGLVSMGRTTSRLWRTLSITALSRSVWLVGDGGGLVGVVGNVVVDVVVVDGASTNAVNKSPSPKESWTNQRLDEEELNDTDHVWGGLDVVQLEVLEVLFLLGAKAPRSAIWPSFLIEPRSVVKSIPWAER